MTEYRSQRIAPVPPNPSIRRLTCLARTSLAIAVLSAALSSCVSTEYTASDYAAIAYRPPAIVPTYDVKPQVIYRIDGHRFISLENYDRCFGDNYYNDTQTGVHTKLLRGNSFVTFRGRLIVDDPSGMNVVIPSASQRPCGDRGCKVPLYYSTDGGRTFNAMPYMNSSYPPRDSESYTIATTGDGIYVFQKRVIGGDYTVSKYPLVRGIDLTRPYPTGMHDESFMASQRPGILPGLHTPSGQDRFTCDESIRPANLPKQQ